MASPGGSAHSPPGPAPLALPRQRPSLVLPGQHSRKSSIASGSLSAHPLRQTSFPPQETLDAQHARARDTSAFSPDEDLDDISDNEVNSAIDGPRSEEPTSKKRKRGGGEKSQRGRRGKGAAARTGSVSVANGEDTRSTKRGDTSVVNAGDEADVEDDEDEEDAVGGGGRVPLYEGGQMTAAEVNEEREKKRLFYESVNEQHRSRAESYYRAKLLKADVRKLVNQTLSQSVPANVVLVVASYTKLFAGMLIEEARQVQAEWAATEAKRPDGGENRAYKKLKLADVVPPEEEAVEPEPEDKTNGEKTTNGTSEETQTTTNGEDTSEKVPNGESVDKDVPSSSSSTVKQANESGDTTQRTIVADEDTLYPGGAGGLSKDIAECDRGPLLPDHLREALRRYKKSRGGGTVGFTGLSLEGREVAAARVGGRRLFK